MRNNYVKYGKVQTFDLESTSVKEVVDEQINKILWKCVGEMLAKEIRDATIGIDELNILSKNDTEENEDAGGGGNGGSGGDSVGKDTV